MRFRSKRWQREMIVVGTFCTFGRGEDELHVRRRLLERLEQRVEGRRRKHVHLVHDVELVAAARRRVLHVVDDDLADLVDLRVRGGVELEHVQAVARGDLAAAVALAARLDRRALHAVERLREDARGRGLAGAARADEDVSLRQPVLLDRVLERARDVLLADDLVERLRAIFAGENRVAHAETLPAHGAARHRKCENIARPSVDLH